MDKIDKSLSKLSKQKRQKLLEAFEKARRGDITGLDIKKLKGHKEIYRLRVGDTRLIFRVLPSEDAIILHIGKRDEQTYRDF